MNNYRLPFRYECMLVLVLCAFVVMCTDPNSITVSIQNSCNDNIKLSKNDEHIAPGEIKENALSLTPDAPKDYFGIWRQQTNIARFTVNGIKFPGEESTEPNKELLDITAEINNPGDPFDDIFTAAPIQNYLTVTKTYQRE